MKIAVRVLVVLVVLGLLGGLAAGLFLDSLAKQAIERGGTHALGVETKLESASLGLTSGKFALAGLSVANPPGFAEPDFFALRATELELPLTSLLDQRVTIPSLVLEGITLDLERNASGTNYGVILDSLARFESSEGASTTSGPASEGGKTFHLQRLVIRDVRATANLVPTGGDLTKLSLAVPEIVVDDMASDMTLPQLCALVVRTVVSAAVKVGAGVLPEELLTDLRGRVDALEGVARERVDQELGKVESRLEEQAKKLGPEAEKALQDASKKLDGKLDGLLKKKN